MFPNLSGQSGYNKRRRLLSDTMGWLISTLAAATSIGADNMWVADSTTIECARSRETVHRSELAGWAEYGYCASTFPVLLGTSPAFGLHPARAAAGLGGHRSQSR